MLIHKVFSNGFISSNIFKAAHFFLFTVLTVNFAFAQVPVNDNPCSGTTVSAINLTPTAACSYATFSNVAGTNSNGPGIPNPSCGGFQDADVWFTATVPTGANSLVIDTKNLSLSDGAMAVYTVTGTCPNLTMTEFACADIGSANPGMPKITVFQPSGTTVYIRFWGVAGETGTFGICVTANIPPVNDDCANATNLTVNPNLLCGTVTAGTTNNATMSTNTPSPTCGTVNGWNDDVWYTFTATAAFHKISLLNITPATSMTMVIYSGTCGALTQVSCANANTLTVNGLTAGAVYTIRVYTNGSTSAFMANFNICVGTPPPPPSNDDCMGAVSLTVNPNYACAVATAGNTAAATQSLGVPTPTCSATGINDDVWFSFVATGITHRISLLNISGGTGMTSVLYSGSCTALTQLNCTTANLYNVTGLTAGQTYYVRVFTTVATVTTEATFNICVGTPPPPPANDECTGAIALTVNQNQLCGSVTAGTTEGATQSSNLPTPSCGVANGWNDDVWFSFVATAPEHIIRLLNVTGTSTNMLVSVYSGTCNSLSLIACVDPDPVVVGLSSLVQGQTYFIRVQTAPASADDANFDICIGTPPPLPVCSGNPPAGLTCADATPICNFEGYCGNTTPHTPQTWSELSTAFCGSIENNSFVTFVASSTTASFNVWVKNCTNNQGIQMFFYTGGCGSGAVTSHGCYNQIFPTPTGGAPTLVSATGLTIGATYYLMFDGFGGDVCDFTLSAGAGVNVLTVTPTSASICNGAGVTLTASGGNGTYSWSPSTGLNTTTGATVNASPSVTTTYTVTSSSSGCTTASGSATVSVGNTPNAPIVSGPVTYCQNATASPLSATGSNLLWYTAASGGTGASIAPTPSTSVPGSITYYVSQTNGTCEGPRASITVTVSATPVAPTTSPIAYCQGAAAMPLTATGSNLLWYTTATGGTGVTTPPTPSTATVGNTVYYVSQSTGACEGPRAQLVVTVSASPAAPGTSPVIYCQNATAVPLTASGNNLLWYSTATGGTGNTAAPTPSTTTVGSFLYYVSQTAGACEGPRASITVTVNATPASPVTAPVSYCEGATALPLSATGNNLLWYTVSAGGMGAPTAPVPSTSAAGSVFFYVSQSAGSCESPRAILTVLVNPIPAAPSAISPVSYCRGASSVALTASGTNLLWYTVATGGIGSSTAPIPSTAVVGNTTYYVSRSIGTCEGSRTPIIVTVDEVPGIPTVTSPVLYCQNASVSPLIATGSNLLWYSVPTGGTGTNIAPIPSSANVNSTTFYVTQSTGSCEGPRASITVNINPSLMANAGNSISIASGQQTQLNGTGTPGANYLWTANGPLALNSATILTPVANPLQTTTYTLTVSDPANICAAASSSVVITVLRNCINIRNAFTPNGDGINDRWFVYDQSFCLQPGGVSVNVFNRYGSKVYESKNYNNTWDGTYKGKPVPDGTYFAIIEFNFLDGTRQIRRTDVTVLR